MSIPEAPVSPYRYSNDILIKTEGRHVSINFRFKRFVEGRGSMSKVQGNISLLNGMFIFSESCFTLCGGLDFRR